jgi:hypothetical protein
MADHEALHRRERQWSEIDDVSRRRDRLVEFSPIGHDAVGQGYLVGAARLACRLHSFFPAD